MIGGAALDREPRGRHAVHLHARGPHGRQVLEALELLGALRDERVALHEGEPAVALAGAESQGLGEPDDGAGPRGVDLDVDDHRCGIGAERGGEGLDAPMDGLLVLDREDVAEALQQPLGLAALAASSAAVRPLGEAGPPGPDGVAHPPDGESRAPERRRLLGHLRAREESPAP